MSTVSTWTLPQKVPRQAIERPRRFRAHHAHEEEPPPLFPAEDSDHRPNGSSSTSSSRQASSVGFFRRRIMLGSFGFDCTVIARARTSTRARAESSLTSVNSASYRSNVTRGSKQCRTWWLFFAFAAKYSCRRISNTTERLACHGKHVKRHLSMSRSAQVALKILKLAPSLPPSFPLPPHP